MRDFTYDFDDRMIQVANPWDSLADIEYDAMGRRLISTDNDGNKTLYYYDGIRVILEKTKPSGSGSWYTSQVYTLQEDAIGFIISSRDTATGDDTWYHYDRLGTVMNLTDATGAVTATYSQDAFGNVLSGSSDGFHLTTKRHYPAIGLYYFYQRWYDPELGRFLTRAPLPPALEHPYVYSSNNPVNHIDPRGERDWGPLGGRCCNKSNGDEYALVNGKWILLKPGKCTGFMQDCDGMTCGGGFYWIGFLDRFATGKTPGHDHKKYAKRRWTPTEKGPEAKSPCDRGSPGLPPNL